MEPCPGNRFGEPCLAIRHSEPHAAGDHGKHSPAGCGSRGWHLFGEGGGAISFTRALMSAATHPVPPTVFSLES